METLQILTIIAGLAMSFGYYPQGYRIWKLKSAEQLSITNYSILSIGTAIWLLYGILMRDLVIIISFSVSLFGAWGVLFLTVYYRRNKKSS